MLQLLAHSPHRIRRLAWLGALVLVLRFAGAELHHVYDVHEPGESCESCLVLERGGHALPAASVPLASVPASAAPVTAPAAVALPGPRPAPLPRGPPLLSA